METDRPRSLAILAGVGGVALKYCAYFVFTPAVLAALAGLVLSYETIFGPEMPWLRHFAFVIPFDSSGTAHLDEQDVMRVFSVLAFAFMIISQVLRGLWFLWKRSTASSPSRPGDEDVPFQKQAPDLLHRPEVRIILRRLVITVSVLTVIFIITFAAIPFADWAPDSSPAGGFMVFAFFYVLAMVSATVYVAMDGVSNVILAWAVSQLQ